MADSDVLAQLREILGVGEDKNVFDEVRQLMDDVESMDMELDEMREKQGVVPERDALSNSLRQGASDAVSHEELKRVYDELLADHAELQQQHNLLQDESEAEKERFALLESKNKQLLDDNKKLAEAEESARRQLRTAASRSEAAEADKRKNQESNKEAQQIYVKLLEENQGLHHDNKDLQHDVELLVAHVHEKEEAEKEAKADCEVQHNKVLELEIELDKAKHDLEEKEKENTKLQIEVAEADAHEAHHERDLEVVVSRFRAEAVDKDEKVAQLRAQITALEATLTQIKGETAIAGLEAKIAALEAQHNADAAALKDEREKHEDTHAQLLILGEHFKQEEAREKEIIEDAIAEEKRQQNALRGDLADKARTVEDKTRAMKQLEKQLAEMHAENHDLEQLNAQYVKGYGLEDAVLYQKKLKEDLKAKDAAFRDMSHRVSEAEDNVNMLQQRVKMLKGKALEKGATEEDLQFDDFELRDQMQGEVANQKSLNQRLETEIEHLEKERVRLLQVLRDQAVQGGHGNGAGGVDRTGLSDDQLILVTEFVQNLREGKANLTPAELPPRVRDLLDERGRLRERLAAQEGAVKVLQHELNVARSSSAPDSAANFGGRSDSDVKRAADDASVTSAATAVVAELREQLESSARANRSLRDEIRTLVTQHVPLLQAKSAAAATPAARPSLTAPPSSSAIPVRVHASGIGADTSATQAFDMLEMHLKPRPQGSPGASPRRHRRQRSAASDSSSGSPSSDHDDSARDALVQLKRAYGAAVADKMQLQSQLQTVQQAHTQAQAQLRQQASVQAQPPQQQMRPQPQSHPSGAAAAAAMATPSARAAAQLPLLTPKSPGGQELLRRQAARMSLPPEEWAAEVAQLHAQLLCALEELAVREDEAEANSALAAKSEALLRAARDQMAELYHAHAKSERNSKDQLDSLRAEVEAQQREIQELNVYKKQMRQLDAALEGDETGSSASSAARLKHLTRSLTVYQVNECKLKRRYTLLEADKAAAERRAEQAEAAALEIETTLRRRVLRVELWKKGAAQQLVRQQQQLADAVPARELRACRAELSAVSDACRQHVLEAADLRAEHATLLPKARDVRHLRARVKQLETAVSAAQATCGAAQAEAEEARAQQRAALEAAVGSGALQRRQLAQLSTQAVRERAESARLAVEIAGARAEQEQAQEALRVTDGQLEAERQTSATLRAELSSQRKAVQRLASEARKVMLAHDGGCTAAEADVLRGRVAELEAKYHEKALESHKSYSQLEVAELQKKHWERRAKSSRGNGSGALVSSDATAEITRLKNLLCDHEAHSDDGAIIGRLQRRFTEAQLQYAHARDEGERDRTALRRCQVELATAQKQLLDEQSKLQHWRERGRERELVLEKALHTIRVQFGVGGPGTDTGAASGDVVPPSISLKHLECLEAKVRDLHGTMKQAQKQVAERDAAYDRLEGDLAAEKHHKTLLEQESENLRKIVESKKGREGRAVGARLIEMSDKLKRAEVTSLRQRRELTATREQSALKQRALDRAEGHLRDAEQRAADVSSELNAARRRVQMLETRVRSSDHDGELELDADGDGDAGYGTSGMRAVLAQGEEQRMAVRETVDRDVENGVFATEGRRRQQRQQSEAQLLEELEMRDAEAVRTQQSLASLRTQNDELEKRLAAATAAGEQMERNVRELEERERMRLQGAPTSTMTPLPTPHGVRGLTVLDSAPTPAGAPTPHSMARVNHMMQAEHARVQRAAQTTIASLKEMLGEKSRIIEELQTRLRRAREQNLSERDAEGRLEARQHERAYRDNESAIAQLRDALRDLHHRGAGGGADKDALEAAGVSAAVEQRLVSAEQVLAERDARVEELEESLKRLRNERDIAEARAGDLLGQVEEIKAQSTLAAAHRAAGTDIDAKQSSAASAATKPGKSSTGSAALAAREREANKQLLAQSNSKMAKLRQAIVKLKADLIEAETRAAATLSDERAGEDKELSDANMRVKSVQAQVGVLEERVGKMGQKLRAGRERERRLTDECSALRERLGSKSASTRRRKNRDDDYEDDEFDDADNSGRHRNRDGGESDDADKRMDRSARERRRNAAASAAAAEAGAALASAGKERLEAALRRHKTELEAALAREAAATAALKKLRASGAVEGTAKMRQLQERVEVLQAQNEALRAADTDSHPGARSDKLAAGALDAAGGRRAPLGDANTGRGGASPRPGANLSREAWAREKALQQRVEKLKSRLEEKSVCLTAAEAQLERARQEASRAVEQRDAANSRAAKEARVVAGARDGQNELAAAQQRIFELEEQNAGVMAEARRQQYAGASELREQLADAQARYSEAQEETLELRDRLREIEHRRDTGSRGAGRRLGDNAPDELDNDTEELRAELRETRHTAREQAAKLLESDAELVGIKYELEEGRLEAGRLRRRVEELQAGLSMMSAGGRTGKRGAGERFGGGGGVGGARERDLEAVVDALKRVSQKQKAELERLKRDTPQHAKQALALKQVKGMKARMKDLMDENQQLKSSASQAEESQRRIAQLMDSVSASRRAAKAKQAEIEQLTRQAEKERLQRQRLERDLDGAEARARRDAERADRAELLGGGAVDDAIDADAAKGGTGAELKRQLARQEHMLKSLRAQLSERGAGERGRGSARQLTDAKAEAADLRSQLASLRRENASLLRDRLQDKGSERAPAAAEVKRLKADNSRLADQNAKLTKELSAFDLDFFEEIEDLKYQYQTAVTKLRKYESRHGQI